MESQVKSLGDYGVGETLRALAQVIGSGVENPAEIQGRFSAPEWRDICGQHLLGLPGFPPALRYSKLLILLGCLSALGFQLCIVSGSWLKELPAEAFQLLQKSCLWKPPTCLDAMELKSLDK